MNSGQLSISRGPSTLPSSPAAMTPTSSTPPARPLAPPRLPPPIRNTGRMRCVKSASMSLRRPPHLPLLLRPPAWQLLANSRRKQINSSQPCSSGRRGRHRYGKRHSPEIGRPERRLRPSRSASPGFRLIASSSSRSSRPGRRLPRRLLTQARCWTVIFKKPPQFMSRLKSPSVASITW